MALDLSLDTFWGSWNQHRAWQAEREANGTQPSLPLMNPEFLLAANCCYFAITFGLYFIMSRVTRAALSEGLYEGSPFKAVAIKRAGGGTIFKAATVLDIKYILFVYNVICVIAAGTVVYGVVKAKLTNPGSFACNPVDHTPAGHELTWYIWLFYAQKFFEYFDTWGFILRQSFRQVTFLHVFHHSSITVVVGLIVPAHLNGDMYLAVILNSCVHVLMYSHYACALLKMSTPWKSLLTSMQLLQFVLIATQSAMSLSRGPGCGKPTYAKWTLIAYMASMVGLFGHFFYKSYIAVKPGTALPGSKEGTGKKSD